MIDERELERIRCIGDDGAMLIVVCFQLFMEVTNGAKRRFPGARRWALLDGQAVRVIDSRTFEVTATGELITKR